LGVYPNASTCPSCKHSLISSGVMEVTFSAARTDLHPAVTDGSKSVGQRDCREHLLNLDLLSNLHFQHPNRDLELQSSCNCRSIFKVVDFASECELARLLHHGLRWWQIAPIFCNRAPL